MGHVHEEGGGGHVGRGGEASEQLGLCASACWLCVILQMCMHLEGGGQLMTGMAPVGICAD